MTASRISSRYTPRTTPAGIAALLETAAAHLETYGWVQGFYDLDAEDFLKCGVSARIALGSAAGRYPWENRVPTVVHAAQEAFADWLRTSRGCTDQPGQRAKEARDRDLIDAWNNAADRTAEQVITALRECAADLRKDDE